jgi:DNA-binding protein
MQMENGALIVSSVDAALKINDVAEKIICGIMESGELNVVGVGEGIYLTCASINFAKEIANVHINEIFLDYIEPPGQGKFESISCLLSTKEGADMAKLVVEEEKDMNLTTGRDGQIVNVGRNITLDSLLTLLLIKFSMFKKIKVCAAGSSINDAVSLCLKLCKAGISKETIGIDLIDLYTIEMRADPTKKITAISIYLKKGSPTQYSEKHLELLRKIS